VEPEYETPVQRTFEPQRKQTSLDEDEHSLEIEMDENYLNDYAESLNKMSILTQSLMN
jgi:hypothetical protein